MPKYTKEQLEITVKDSTNKAEVLRKLGLRAAGGNMSLLQKYINLWNIDTSHFPTPSERVKLLHSKGLYQKIKLEDILIENSIYNRGHLKNRLYKLGIKQRLCELCGQDEYWQGRKMSLILDHINGIYNDNRLENLRIVCPNCNATLDTHCSRNIKKSKISSEIKSIKNVYPKLDKRFGSKPKRPENEKISWPSVEELKTMVETIGYSATGRKLNVSDNAVRKRIRTNS